MKVKIETDVIVPKPVSFLRLNENKGATVSIACLSNDELEAVGKQWTINLINHASEIRNKNA